MIVTVADLLAHLGLTTEDADRDTLLSALLGRVESAFCAACGRSDMPFLAASTGDITEVTDGTGDHILFASRPVASVTSVVVGDVNAPALTVDGADMHVTPGRRMIRAKDAFVRFGDVDAPGAVTITYTAAADAPADVQLAITRAAAALYLQRGAEDVRAESEGGMRSELANAFSDPSWTDAVAAHRELQVG